MLEVIKEMPEQVVDAFNNYAKDVSFNGFNKIVCAGMGGSGVTGAVIKAMADFPVSVYNDYRVYENIDSKTLLVIVSYSGNTEESLEVYEEGVKKGCKICGITSGGKLQKMCEKDNIEYVKIPEGYEPRAAIAYLVFALARVLQNSGVLDVNIEGLSALMNEGYFDDKAKEIAKAIGNKLPIIYSSEKFKAVAYRWKCDINENSKMWGISNVFPEANHNEILPMTKQKDVFIVLIKDKDDDKRVKRRMEVIEKIAKKSKVGVMIVEPKGENIVEKVFSTVFLGSLVSCYLAKNHKVDANEMELLEDFKKML